ncbi:hypothetical protein [Streptomyces nondiastaticus]|uniref:Uncharacterized protein n=1 Tax=Streptomyces nondiastaticus TaxID=3154512 RepID=A0ABW6TRM2_9ACTN
MLITEYRGATVNLKVSYGRSSRIRSWPENVRLPSHPSARTARPTAMRKALLECSRDKIASVGEENKEIGRLLVHMQGLGHSVLVPFELEQVELTVAEADLLIESGVFSKASDGRYWVPEIHRHGLGFNSERRARALW